MNIRKKMARIATVLESPHLLRGDSKYIFLISHMRSRSTVLTHILGSNNDICGYSELHRKYHNRLDLLKMRVELYQDLRENQQGKYLLDKLLHNKLTVTDNIINRVNSKFIFLLRKPVSTIKSIVKMGQLRRNERFTNISWVIDYYCSRLATMEKLALRTKGHYIYIESDDLINNTDSVLRDISEWLALETPLKNEYSHFNNSGKPGFGDPSSNIHKGLIERTPEHLDIIIPNEIEEMGQYAYQRCHKILTSHQHQ